MKNLWKILGIVALLLVGLVGLSMSICGGVFLAILLSTKAGVEALPFMLFEIGCIAVGIVVMISAAFFLRETLAKR